jgi:hypothetical protein
MAGGADVLVFVDLIAFSEGTPTVKGSEDCYGVLYGGGTVSALPGSPAQAADLSIRAKPVTITATERYQYLSAIGCASDEYGSAGWGYAGKSGRGSRCRQIRERRALVLLIALLAGALVYQTLALADARRTHADYVAGVARATQDATDDARAEEQRRQNEVS